MAISITTAHGTDANGRLVYSAEEHDALHAATGRMSDDQFRDWQMAPFQGRVRGAGDAPADAPKTYTRQEYKAAARRTDRMTEQEYADFCSAPDEGRITD
jgi:hypothetical protein